MTAPLPDSYHLGTAPRLHRDPSRFRTATHPLQQHPDRDQHHGHPSTATTTSTATHPPQHYTTTASGQHHNHLSSAPTAQHRYPTTTGLFSTSKLCS